MDVVRLLVYHRCLGVGLVTASSWTESQSFAEVENLEGNRCTHRGKGSRSGALDGKCATYYFTPCQFSSLQVDIDRYKSCSNSRNGPSTVIHCPDS